MLSRVYIFKSVKIETKKTYFFSYVRSNIYLHMKQCERTIDNIDYLFVVGTCKEENQYLIDKSQCHDLWFHISNYPSCHVVCQIQNASKPNKKHLHKIIKQGALCCKAHSKYKRDKNVDITYATIGQLESTDKIGKVIVHNSKTITI